MEQVKERVRVSTTGARVDSLAQDVRYASRALRSSPGYAVWVVGSLAIGMAVTIAALALLNATMVLPFPGVTNQQRLVRVSVSRNCGRPDCWIRMSSPSDVRGASRRADGPAGFCRATRRVRFAVALPEARSMRGIVDLRELLRRARCPPSPWPRLRRATMMHARRGRGHRAQRLDAGVRRRPLGDRPIDPRRRRVRAHRRRGAGALHRHRSHQARRSRSGSLASDVAGGPRACRSRRPSRAGRNATSPSSAD